MNSEPGADWRTSGVRALVVGVAIITTACGATAVDPSGSLSAASAAASGRPAVPSSATAPDRSPTTAPPPSAAPDSPYAIGTTVQVVADVVRVREAPGTSAEIVAALSRDARAVVLGGPVEADGYTWFEVESSAGTGWVAAGDAEDRWIVVAPPLEPAGLAFRFRSMCDATPLVIPPTLTITADRDVVMASPDDGRMLAGRLTPGAFSELMAVLDHPALAESAAYRPELRPDAGEPPGHGLCIFEFTLGSPSDRVRVTSVSWFGDEEESAYYVPSPERRALDELARRVMVGPDLFTDASWETAPTEYEADAFLVWILSEAAEPTADVPSLSELQVIGDVTTFGEPIESGRCGYLDRAAAGTIALAFAGSPSPLTLNAVSYLTVQTESGWANIVTSPLTPDGFPTCGDIPG
jgi:hypothetical protein